MDTSVILSLVKANLNIFQDVRDDYLSAIIEGVIAQLQDEQGLELDGSNPYHMQFVVDLAAWRYRSRGEDGAMPLHLQSRMRNMMLHNPRGNTDVQ